MVRVRDYYFTGFHCHAVLLSVTFDHRNNGCVVCGEKGGGWTAPPSPRNLSLEFQTVLLVRSQQGHIITVLKDVGGGFYIREYLLVHGDDGARGMVCSS